MDRCRLVLADGVTFSAFVDLYLAIYPTAVLMRLNMSLKKPALCAALGLGAV